ERARLPSARRRGRQRPHRGQEGPVAAVRARSARASVRRNRLGGEMKSGVSRYASGFGVVAALAIGARTLAADDPIDRTVLPVPDPQYPAITELDARNAKAPPRFEVKAPKGAPNVVIVLIDDIGFGQSSAFGGPAKMPTLDKLAAAGLRYNDFHTTALCS